jgi:hypothetical protein
MTMHNTVRAPIPVLAAATLVVLLAAVTSYGAIYFTFFFQHPLVTDGGLIFVAFFLALKATAVIAAVGMLRGRRLAWQLLIGYAVVWELGFSIAKLAFWHETEALLFGGITLVVLVPLLLTPVTRRHVGQFAGTTAARS